jgi:hypothetical protein
LMGNLARCGTLNYVPPNGGKQIKLSIIVICFHLSGKRCFIQDVVFIEKRRIRKMENGKFEKCLRYYSVWKNSKKFLDIKVSHFCK